MLIFRIARSCACEYADAPYAVALLRAHRERPRGCYATGKRNDELAPSHCLPRGSALGIVSAQPSVLEGPMSALGQKQTYAAHQPMSALPLKADMCGATKDVRFGPKADIRVYSITSSARVSRVGGTLSSSALAVLRLITSSNFVGSCTG